jgi:hypothetical protein
MMLAAIARRTRSAPLNNLLGPISEEGTVVLVGMSDTSFSEAQSLRRQTPVTLITDISSTDRRDVVRQLDGREVDLRWDNQLDLFVHELPLPPDVRTAVRKVLGTVAPGARRELGELARVWSGAYAGSAIPRRLVLSGHGDGTWISGNDGDFIKKDWLLDLAKAMPLAAAQIYSIHLGACQHGWEPRLALFPKVFPNVQELWGYAGTSPSGPPAEGHQRLWERSTHDFPAGGGTASPKDVRGTSRGDVATDWTRARGYEGPKIRPLEQLLQLAQAGLAQLDACMRGDADPGAPHQGFANDYYQLLQELTTYPQAGDDWARRREQALRLRFYMASVRSCAQKEWAALIQSGFQQVGLPVPDFSTLDRKQAIDQISQFEAAMKRHPGSPVAAALWQKLVGLRDLDAGIIRFEWVLH